MKRDMPEPWATAVRKKGFVRADGEPSLRALAAAAGTNVETTRRLVWGRGKSGDDVIRHVAVALGVSVGVASAWAQLPRQVDELYVPPQEAHFLTEKQRAAVDQVIKAMVDRDTSKTGARDDTTATNQADVEQVDVGRPDAYDLVARRGTPIQAQIDAAEPDPNVDPEGPEGGA